VAGCCACGHGLSGSVKLKEFLDCVGTLASQVGPWVT
jgi:hypothetical protein